MNTVMRTLLRVAFAASTTLSGAAFAGEIKVLPNDTAWRNLPNELRENATAGITGTAPRSGDGSLELTGPRTRFAIGNIYPNAATTPLIALNQVTGLTFDWRIAGDSVNPYNPDYTPALRLHIWDAGAGVRREIIWEGAYNGRYGLQTVPDTWYSSTLADSFYVGAGNENNGRTVAAWAQSYAPGSFVAAISVGSGGGAGAYHGFADNVTLVTTGGSTTYNFELTAGAVPEPATWAMMIVGVGAVGGATRARRRKAVVAAA